jgi:ABC-type uncharacterized transport system permease subunit
MPLDRVSILCFAASYAVALVMELIHVLWPRPLVRVIGLTFGVAGLVAHTLYLAFQPPLLSSQFGSLLFLGWILAVFFVYGSLHHRRLSWGIFVLPIVLALVVVAGIEQHSPHSETPWLETIGSLRGIRFWRLLHYALLLLAAVGVSVSFIASLMYLVQARRLRTKVMPGGRLRLLSLERLEEMSRRGINLAFPLLTAGVAIGAFLMVQNQRTSRTEAIDAKVMGSILLWLVFALLLYLRYGLGQRGRRMALVTIAAFVLLVVTLTSAHPLMRGVAP